jgi:hypothetical protein
MPVFLPAEETRARMRERNREELERNSSKPRNDESRENSNVHLEFGGTGGTILVAGYPETLRRELSWDFRAWRLLAAGVDLGNEPTPTRSAASSRSRFPRETLGERVSSLSATGRCSDKPMAETTGIRRQP